MGNPGASQGGGRGPGWGWGEVGERSNPKALRKGRRLGTGTREEVSPCAGGRPWSWRAPVWAPHMWTARRRRETLAWAAQLCMAHAPAARTLFLRPNSVPSPSDTGPRPASGLPSCPAAAAASAPTPSGRLLSQAQAVPPAASSESLPRLISFSSLPLSLSLFPSPSVVILSLLPSQAHPSSLSLSLSVSERGAAGGEEGRALVGWALIRALSTNPSLGRDHCSDSSD